MQAKTQKINLWIMWGLASFFYAYQYVIRVLPNIMMPDITAAFHINASAFGQFSGFYYIGYAAMHIPLGILLDRIGPKRVMPLCVLFTVLGLLPLLYSDQWVYPCLGRALIGMGSSAAILGVFKVIRIAFAESMFTRMLGISVTIGLLGAIYGGRPVNALLSIWGWKTVVYSIVAVGIALSLALYWIIPEIEKTKHSKNIWQDIQSVLGNRKVVGICILAGLMVGPLEGFADAWGTEFLKAYYHFEASFAAGLPSLIFLGMCVGAPMLSHIAEKTQRYHECIAASALIMGLGFIAILNGGISPTLMKVLLLIIGVLCAYQILAIYKTTHYIPKELMGLCTACANMIIMLFGYLFHGVIGKAVHAAWDGTLRDGIPVYNGAAYAHGLMVIPLGLLLAAVGYAVIAHREQKQLSEKMTLIERQ